MFVVSFVTLAATFFGNPSNPADISTDYYIIILLILIFMAWDIFGSTMIVLGKDSLFMKKVGKYEIPLHFSPIHWLNIPKRLRRGIWGHNSDQPGQKLLLGSWYEWGIPSHILRIIVVTVAMIGLLVLVKNLL